MKKFLYVLLAALVVISALSCTALAASDVAYVAYNTGNDSNTGLSASVPKKTIGSASGNGVFSLVKDGGTLVICEKMYIGDNYKWQANGEVTITANYGGKDYKNTSPASNPASGVLKIKPDCTLTVASDLVLDDLILFSESANNTILVTNGATLTVTNSVISMSKSTYNFNIVVESGAKAVINGGTFDSVTGDGDITIGSGATIKSGATEEKPATNGTVGYISFNTGNDANDGLSESAPKAGLGQTDGKGIASVLKGGGTVVVCGKMYIGSSYAWNVGGATTITANYGGKDYKNTEPASNPASGVIKMKPESILTVASDLTLDDVILFQENNQCTIIVTSGATFTVNESVITMSNTGVYMKVIVSDGSTAVINGGTFDSVSGSGNIVIGEKATILGEAEHTTDEEVKRETTVCYLDYKNGKNTNDGSSADKAVKSYGGGVFARITVGGTVVVSGISHIGGSGANNEYAMPLLAKPLTFTSVYGGVDYKNDTSCLFRFSKDTTFTISSDVTFDNIILVEEDGQTTIHVTNGATLTVTDTAVLKSLKADGSHYKVVVDEGAMAILSANAKKAFTVEGDGVVLDYIDGYTELVNRYTGTSTVVELTIGSDTAYVNGKAEKLSAAPINRQNRTMLPVRFLANAFGVSDDGIKWDGATRTATLTGESVTIVITIGAQQMTVNGASVALDSPAIIESDRTYLPVRAIANALGVSNDNIIWDASTDTATLIK